jgi:GT2 family glycosyltransferase
VAQPRVITVILNTNRRDDTLACLASLRRSDYQNLHILVLDNASTDGSVEAIQSLFPEVQVIPLQANLGYAGNNNVGILNAMQQNADWLFVLNEDTVLAPECLSRLVAAGEANPKSGMVGPLVYHFDEPTVIQSAGGRLDAHWQSRHIGQNELDQGQFDAPYAVDWLSGCALLIRRQVIDEVGALDERFFYYWEETEWCYRARVGGWEIMTIPQAKLWHKGVQRDYYPNPHVTYYNTRNRFLFMAKHHAPFAARTTAWAQVMRTLVSWSVKPRWRKMREHRAAMWQGVTDYTRQRWGKRGQ